jgi:hypothetical protein
VQVLVLEVVGRTSIEISKSTPPTKYASSVACKLDYKIQHKQTKLCVEKLPGNEEVDLDNLMFLPLNFACIISRKD